MTQQPAQPTGTLRVGCAMWGNREWVGTYLPADLPKGHELAAYAAWCTAVEGNTTFYALPAPTAVERWAAQAPPEFRFSFKLPKEITHDRGLRDTAGPLADFLARTEPLHDRFGPISVQLPERFGPDSLGALDGFLHTAPRHLAWSVEVRHRAFDSGSDDERRLNDLLVARGADRVLFHTAPVLRVTPVTPEEREAHERKPRVEVRPVALGAHPVVRLIVPDRGDDDIDEVAEPWRRWIPHLARWVGAGRHVTVFAHTPDNRRAPELARWVHRHVAATVGDLAPALPDPGDAPGQAALF